MILSITITPPPSLHIPDTRSFDSIPWLCRGGGVQPLRLLWAAPDMASRIPSGAHQRRSLLHQFFTPARTASHLAGALVPATFPVIKGMHGGCSSTSVRIHSCMNAQQGACHASQRFWERGFFSVRVLRRNAVGQKDGSSCFTSETLRNCSRKIKSKIN